MRTKLVAAAIALTLSLSIQAKIYDGIEMEDRRLIKGVTLHTAKIDDLRIFHAEQDRVMDAPIAKVLDEVLKFPDRCNNDYKDKRRYTAESFNCRHHNQNLVESHEIRKIKKNYVKEEGEIDRYLLYRNIYNREAFGYYDVVIVKEVNSEKGKRVFQVSYRSLSDAEAKKYLDNPNKRNSAFNHMSGIYTLTEREGKTHMHMTYVSKTDHWLLNKGVSVGLIYKKIAQGTKSTLDNIEGSTTKL